MAKISKQELCDPKSYGKIAIRASDKKPAECKFNFILDIFPK